MLRFTKWLNRFAVALGGFLIFMGMIVTCVFVIIALDVIDFSIFESENFQSISLLLLLEIGLIDLVAGIILWRR